MSEDSANYFDLEDPVSLTRLDEPMTALEALKGRAPENVTLPASASAVREYLETHILTA